MDCAFNDDDEEVELFEAVVGGGDGVVLDLNGLFKFRPKSFCHESGLNELLVLELLLLVPMIAWGLFGLVYGILLKSLFNWFIVFNCCCC